VSERVLTAGRHSVLCGADLPGPADAGWFDAAHWQSAGSVALETSGRGAVLVVKHGAQTWAVRHYHRGGFVARFVADHYVWSGVDSTRSFREWRLLRKLRDAGLPVPNPIAAHVYRTGPIYTADIITTYLPDTRKLSAFISDGTVPAHCWRRIGRMVRAVHLHGVDHPDLTAHNILLDARGSLFLVDFDNARVKPAGSWQRAGVDRLQRSLRKVALETGTEFDPAAWAEIEAGYADPPAAGAAGGLAGADR
jgi:3-deoxy-D-manno-octulosonic acid kinase